MKILFDNQVFQWQKYGGISRYFTELIKGLKAKDVDIEFPLIYTENEYILEHKLYTIYPFFKNYHSLGKNLFIENANLCNQFLNRRAVAASDFDVFHPTYYDPYYLKIIANKKPFVLTVFDMIHEKYPNLLIKDKEVLIRKRNLVNAARKIIAISETTKKDILFYYPEINEEKVEVIYLGNSFGDNNSDSNNEINISYKYILYVGSRFAYKNFTFFIKTISVFLQENKNYKLICTGGGSFKKDEIKLLNDLKISGSVLCFDANDDYLQDLYKNAAVFVFPSLYEGFGLPILEAFYCQCPVILNDNPCFREIAGDAALFFETESRESLLSKIDLIINNELVKKELIEKALARLNLFSWKKTVTSTLNLYKNL